MSLKSVCRTCAGHNNNLVAISTCLDQHANKSISNILRELTQQDPLIEHADDMPQGICYVCCQQLTSAYDFVLQARQVYEELRAKLRANVLGGNQCLDETPIDIPMQLNIKSEIDIDEECFVRGGSADEFLQTDLETSGCTQKQAANAAELKWRISSDSESDERATSAPVANCVENAGLRRSVRKIKRSAKIKEWLHSKDIAFEKLQEQNANRRRGRPPCLEKTTTLNSEGRHMCEVCGKSFSWFRDMQRHARVHFEEASYVCDICGKAFLRKDKYTFHLRSHEKREAKYQALHLNNEWRYAERLYSSGRLKRMECKICGVRCQRIQELRQHLLTHDKLDTLSNFTTDNEIVKTHYVGEKQLQLDEIKEQVCSDIAAQRLDKYCAVVNAYGYELSLSDSDEEVPGVFNYHCAACDMEFTRKHRLIRHTLEEHTQPNQAPAQRCNICKIGFVCAKLYEQHMRTQCRNKLKYFRCAKCPGKFMWLQNLERHACSQRATNEQQQQLSICQCCLCDEHFTNISQLRAHLHTHRDGRSGIDKAHKSAFFQCYYPNGLACSKAELSARIAADFKDHDYARYYNACSASGNELDIYDSDDSNSESEQQTLDLHTCAVCGETTTRLKRLLEHQNTAHSVLAKLPHSCKDCKAAFVCSALLVQHRRRVCGKLHAKYQCTRCNQRFVWQSNYKQHLALHHATLDVQSSANTEVAQRKTKRKSAVNLQCDECEKVFIWHKDLTRHKRIHMPNTAKFECSYCERKFHRKDGLKSHLRVHGDELSMSIRSDTALVKREAVVLERTPVVLTQLCKPNGCKQIQCMICLTRHSKISDLRTHLRSHQFAVQLVGERSTPSCIASLSSAFYPEQVPPLNKQQLIEHIMSDVANNIMLERFYSITNESGYELSLESSETETDSDAEPLASSTLQRLYSCELCRVALPRKHELYAHQLELHEWQEATNVCSHCNARFVNAQLLQHHYRTLCRNTQKRFLCRKCPLRFRWKENLKLHTTVAHQEVKADQESSVQEPDSSNTPAPKSAPKPTPTSYDCLECKRSFKMQKDLTRHTLLHVKESSIYRCRWCARRFYRLGNLLQHIERHGISAEQLPYAEALINANRHAHGQKLIVCKVCDLRFDTIAALRLHLHSQTTIKHHDYGSLQNYSITNQMGYELHIDDSETDEEAKSPSTPEWYTCGMCQLRCKRKYELYQHQQAMHRLERISDGCDQCIFKSVSLQLIEHHKRVQCANTEKQFKCVKCGYKFMWESNLLQHMQLQHEGSADTCSLSLEQREDCVTGQRCDVQIFRCSICPRKYNRKDRLTAHMKNCHAPGSAPVKAEQPLVKQTLEKRFLCAFCGKAVSSSSNLIIHMRRHTGEKPFKCEFCDMAFPRSSDLQCHRRTHTGERPHICTVCDKGFARSYKLQQHMRIHNGERPYKCSYCDKRFTQSNDLTLHIRRHTGERPYQCDICGERFIQGTALKHHRTQQGHHEPVGNAEDKSPTRSVLEQLGMSDI